MDFEAALRKLIADVVRDELQRAVAELRATIGAQNERRCTDDEFVDVQGAAELVGLHQSTIREWIHSGSPRELSSWSRLENPDRGCEERLGAHDA